MELGETMILTGEEIKKQVASQKIHISPFEEKQLNPNSYNFKLGDTLKVYTSNLLDASQPNACKVLKIPQTGFILEPNQLYLGHTEEEMGSDFYVPIMQARSSVGRLGLYIYLNSGLGDLGFKKQWTLELHSIHRLKIYPGMKIGQMLFWKPLGKIQLYDGKYKDAVGPMTSEIWKDFEHNL